MHILLTDALTCPRCGPDFGLILLAERTEARRVASGHLGCPNCRSQYPIRNGVADLRLGASASAESAESSASPESAVSTVSAHSSSSAEDGGGDGGAAVRLAALMGLAGASGLVLIAGPGARHASAVSALVPELETIAVSDSADADSADADSADSAGGAGVSRVLASGAGLPFRGGLRAAALTGGADDARLREALRVLAPGARLVVDPAPAGTAERLRGLGAEVLLDEDGVVVARAPGRPVELRYNAVR
jgi:uncharacterized protein YbaR (Trm112 family)